MKKLIKDQDKFYTPKKRPSGHDISEQFGSNNGGAIPPNLLQIANTESNSQYLRCCKLLQVKGHPARFPGKLPEFFIKFLTDPNDLVVDIFAGSNTTGWIAEQLNRRWLTCDISHEYVIQSIFRFAEGWSEEQLKETYATLETSPVCDIEISTAKPQIGLFG
jgi:site-specific DNA-methyltransferase (cytosine-N4-specific)